MARTSRKLCPRGEPQLQMVSRTGRCADPGAPHHLPSRSSPCPSGWCGWQRPTGASRLGDPVIFWRGIGLILQPAFALRQGQTRGKGQVLPWLAAALPRCQDLQACRTLSPPRAPILPSRRDQTLYSKCCPPVLPRLRLRPAYLYPSCRGPATSCLSIPPAEHFTPTHQTLPHRDRGADTIDRCCRQPLLRLGAAEPTDTMAQREQAIYAETYLALKRALKRKAYGS